MKEKYPHRKGLKLSDIPLDVREIITNLVFETEECIPTIYPNKYRGYGRISRWINKVKVGFSTHRVSQVLFNGEIPDGHIVCHSCDNPSCVNPKHLSICTDAGNSDDKVRKGRQAVGKIHGMYFSGNYTQESLRKREREGKKGKELRHLRREEIKKYIKENKNNLSNRSIAKLFNVSSTTIDNYKRSIEG